MNFVRLPIIPPETALFVSPAPSGASGHHTTYREDGTKWEEFDHADGKHHGPYTRFHRNGTIHFRCHYVDGLRDGPLTVEDTNTPAPVVTYHKGTIHGFTIWTQCERVDVEVTHDVGRSHYACKYYDPKNGTLIGEATFLNGELDGFHRTYNSEGQLVTESEFKDGKSVGLHKTYTSLGRLATESEFKDGTLLSSRTMKYQPGGRSELLNVYQQDSWLTRWTYWYDDGALAEERDLTPDNRIVRMVTLRDRQGRDCLLKDGEITVWKMAKAVVPTTECTTAESKVETIELPFFPTRNSVEGVSKTLTTTTTWHHQQVKTPWVYVRLTVPADARRVTPLDDACAYKSRVEFAKVEEITGEDGTPYTEAFSAIYHDKRLTYRVGEVVRADDFNPGLGTACNGGIHVHAHRDQCDQWKN